METPLAYLQDMRLNSLTRRALRAWHTLRPPRRSTVQNLKGLHASVEVLTDAWGVPHIHATNADDLFFAQGFVTARDRFFQMDYNRHAAAGRLCELVGRRNVPWRDLTVHLKNRTTFDVDVLLRTFGLEAAARTALGAHSDQARQVLTAYAAGVNAWLARGHVPLEHRILGATPRAWEVHDALLMFKGIAFELNFAWRAILFGQMLDNADLPDAVARILWPFAPKDDAPILDSAWGDVFAELAGTRAAADSALGLGNAPGVGSNSFAVDAKHSATGTALLANDTHLLMTAPTPWYEIGLHGGGFDLHGFALAGVPVLGIGQTPHHAWSITAGMVQDLDMFAEKINPDNPHEVLTPQGWAPCSQRTETIRIRGEGDVQHTVLGSRHGPFLHTQSEGAAGQRLAVCWTGHEPGRELDALLALAQSTDLETCMQAAQHQMCPTYNITYAGADGRIAYVLAGLLPKRRSDTPLRPLEGWTDTWDWQGFVPWQQNPRCVDPPTGILVTANNRVTAASSPHSLGDLFDPSWRFNRITQRLQQQLPHGVTRETMAALQMDTHSAFGLAARDAFFALVGGPGGCVPPDAKGEDAAVMRAAAQVWATWDGDTGCDAAGPVVGLPVPIDIAREVVRSLAGEDAAWGFVELGSMVSHGVLQLLASRDLLTDYDIDLASIARDTFAQHVRAARAQQGVVPALWKWGRAHRLTMRHRMHGSPLQKLFSLGPEPAPGGPDTVCRGDFDSGQSFNMRVGAAMRAVFDAGDTNAARTILPGGQSGARFSPHYDDQLALFLQGRLKDTRVRRDDLVRPTREEFVPFS